MNINFKKVTRVEDIRRNKNLQILFSEACRTGLTKNNLEIYGFDVNFPMNERFRLLLCDLGLSPTDHLTSLAFATMEAIEELGFYTFSHQIFRKKFMIEILTPNFLNKIKIFGSDFEIKFVFNEEDIEIVDYLGNEIKDQLFGLKN